MVYCVMWQWWVHFKKEKRQGENPNMVGGQFTQRPKPGGGKREAWPKQSCIYSIYSQAAGVGAGAAGASQGPPLLALGVASGSLRWLWRVCAAGSELGLAGAVGKGERSPQFCFALLDRAAPHLPGAGALWNVSLELPQAGLADSSCPSDDPLEETRGGPCAFSTAGKGWSVTIGVSDGLDPDLAYDQREWRKGHTSWAEKVDTDLGSGAGGRLREVTLRVAGGESLGTGYGWKCLQSTVSGCADRARKVPLCTLRTGGCHPPSPRSSSTAPVSLLWWVPARAISPPTWSLSLGLLPLIKESWRTAWPSPRPSCLSWFIKSATQGVSCNAGLVVIFHVINRDSFV
ncbi:PREDICTED: uncharacterized protein LOC103595754 isoform X2 [Galeopterus variegatus]|uniref:Uncharacterized protein LOC103595754 isoform X1 n=1 Tax=Galeopterus variegatus TaxID=482537 RepID=A0ABM0R9Z7_GALVR|nr:PREDICTED: uncharacterized protein LOC103595754 isoform X1 [Galeopterus variegatus]XP_008577439.1 PREDICTED: uncharacterized protein LOC103595754 isoform X2 [Galeopterus variegatus]